MEVFESIRDFLVTYGIWTILLLAIAKTFTGILIAIQENGFKWHKIGETFKEGDFLKVAAFSALALLGFSEVSADNVQYVQGTAAMLLTADLTGGLVRNLGMLFPSIYGALPKSLKDTKESDL